MAKTNWGMNDTVMPTDMNQIGQEINETAAAVEVLQDGAILKDGSTTFTGQIKSSLSTGTSPFSVVSTSVVTNLNTDMVDGYHLNQDVRSTASPTFAGVTSPRYTSTQATGTAPFTVASQTVVTNLNADLLDGQHGSYYAPLASPALTGNPTAPTQSPGTNNTRLANTAFVAAALANIQPPDVSGLAPKDAPAFTGAASFAGTVAFNSQASFNVATGSRPFNVASTTVVTNLNADMLDGLHASEFARTASPKFFGTTSFSSQTAPGQLTISVPVEGSIDLQADYDTEVQDGNGHISFFASGVSFNAPLYFNNTSGAPFTVNTQTRVGNLNADMVDGYHANVSQSNNTIVVRGATGNVIATQYLASAPNGTPPLDVVSSTLVANLNADRVDGYHAAEMITPMATSSGTSSSLSATFSPAFAKINNRSVRVKAHTTTSGAPTLNANGTGAAPIKKPDGTAAQLISGGVYTLVWDSAGSAFILQGEGGDSGKFVKYVYAGSVVPFSPDPKHLEYIFTITDDYFIGKDRNSFALNFKMMYDIVDVIEYPEPPTGNMQRVRLYNFMLGTTNQTSTQADFRLFAAGNVFEVLGYCRIINISGNVAEVKVWFNINGDGEFYNASPLTADGYVFEI